jgi:hypothetical protein
MAAEPWTNKLFRHGASGFSGLLLALLIAPALQASPTATITASVEVPTNPISEPPVLSNNGSVMAVALRDPVQINANVPSRVALSPLQLVPPPRGEIGGGGRRDQPQRQWQLADRRHHQWRRNRSNPGGSIATSVSARVYSTTTQPLPAGSYTASTVISVVAD